MVLTPKKKWHEITLKYHDNLKTDQLPLDEGLTIYRHNIALEYITGYLIEYTLSADNVFVILLIFLSFGLKEKLYKRVLSLGILGA